MKRMLLIQVFMLFFTAIMAGAAAPEWVFYGESGDDWSTLYYDKSNIIPIGNRMVRMTVKYVYTEKGRKMVIDSRKQSEYSVTGFDKLSHSVVQYEIDCRKKQWAFFSITELKKDGTELDHYDPQIREWTTFKSGGTAEALFEKVCGSK